MCASKLSENESKSEDYEQPENEAAEDANNGAIPEPLNEYFENIFDNENTVLEDDEAVAARLQN